VARPREEVRLPGLGLKKNKEKSPLGSKGLGATSSSLWLLATSPF